MDFTKLGVDAVRALERRRAQTYPWERLLEPLVVSPSQDRWLKKYENVQVLSLRKVRQSEMHLLSEFQ